MQTDADKHNTFACRICKKPAVSFHYGACDDCTKAALENYIKSLRFLEHHPGLIGGITP